MHYSLLTRGLSVPANPHLVNLNQPASASSSPGPSGGGGGGHHALNQLIATTNMAKSKEITSSSSSSTSLAAAPLVTPSITRTVIPGAAIGAAARASGKRQPTDNVAYRFSFPKGGLFVTHFLKGRLEILRAIKRQMFGDILVSVCNLFFFFFTRHHEPPHCVLAVFVCASPTGTGIETTSRLVPSSRIPYPRFDRQWSRREVLQFSLSGHLGYVTYELEDDD